MGLLDRKDPPQITDNGSAVIPSVPPADPEKPSIEDHLEGSRDGTPHNYIDPDVERRVVRKLDWHVCALVTGLCKSDHCSEPSLRPLTLPVLLSYLDRSNIGNAKIAGMTKDLSLTGNRYQWLLTIFYISYILFQFQAFMWRILSNYPLSFSKASCLY